MKNLINYGRKIILLLLLVTTVTVLSGCIPLESYTITFDVDGGTDVHDITVEEGKSFIEPTEPSKDGYSFNGWYTDINGWFSAINYYDFTSDVEGDIKLTARWTINEYRILYFINRDVIEHLAVLDYDTLISQEDPLQEGYTFNGWYYDEELTVPLVEQTRMPSNSLEFYAKWEINEYTLTLDTNGGDSIEPITQEYLTDITNVIPTALGYIFYGWYTDVALLVPYDELDLTSLPSTMPSSDMTLYAGWILDETAEIDCEVYTDHYLCSDEYLNPSNILDILPDEEITITFWHVYTQNKSELLDRYISQFEILYPNVTINSIAQGTYNDLRAKVIMSITAGVNPTMVIGYSDHIVQYLQGNAVIPLNDYINNVNIGVDLEDFIPSYIEENNQYPDGLMYSMPYSKSSEVLIINSSLFEANGLTVKTDAPYTWEELDALALILVGDGPNQCEYLINYDSPSNFFISSLSQWGISYTNINGDILFNNATTIEMLTYIQTRFDNNTFVIPIAWDENYGSENFLAQDVCMTVSSSAGVGYNIPKLGEFEIAIAPIPQYDLDNMYVVQQGPNISIMSNTTEAERLAAWLFITYLINAENTAEWSFNTGYLPVSYGGYNSTLFQEFLTNPDPDYIYESLGVNASYAQIEYSSFESAFTGTYSSADVREQVDMLIKLLFVGYSPESVLEGVMNQLGIN